MSKETELEKFNNFKNSIIYNIKNSEIDIFPFIYKMSNFFNIENEYGIEEVYKFIYTNFYFIHFSCKDKDEEKLLYNLLVETHKKVLNKYLKMNNKYVLIQNYVNKCEIENIRNDIKVIKKFVKMKKDLFENYIILSIYLFADRIIADIEFHKEIHEIFVECCNLLFF